MAMEPEQALEIVDAYCRARSPEDMASEMRIECSRRGNSINILECRAPWHPDWTELKVAQLRRDPKAGTWELRCSDSNGRWWPYDGIGSAAGVEPLLEEIDHDPTGIFWG